MAGGIARGEIWTHQFAPPDKGRALAVATGCD